MKRKFTLPIWAQFWGWRANVHFHKWAANPKQNEKELFKYLKCIDLKFLR